MGVWRPLALGIACLLTSAPFAQDVRESHASYGSMLRRYERLAVDQGHASYPHLAAGDKGTIVDLHFDYDDWDIVLVRPKTIPIEDLLTDARSLAAAMSRPKADFITTLGNKTMVVDVELNDYLPQGKQRTVEFDLDALMEHLSSMPSLERPIWIVVDPTESDTSVIRRHGKADETIDDVAFFSVEADRTGAVIVQSAGVHWYALPLLILFLGGILLAPIFSFFQVLRRPLPAGPEVADQLKSPEDVQREYEEGRKKAWLPMLFPLIMMVFVVAGSSGKLFTQMLRALPDRWMPYFAAVFAASAIAVIAGMILRHRKAVRLGLQKPREDAETRSFKFMTKVMIFPFAFGILLFVTLRLVPQVKPAIPIWFARSLPFLLPAAFIVPLIVGGIVIRRKNYRRLDADDPYRLFAVETAAKARAKVRDVQVYDVDYVNAMVGLDDKVTLTKGLLAKMEPDEIRAIIAHEIGHQRSKHVRKFFVLSLSVVALLITLQMLLREVFPNVSPLLRSPLLTMPLVFLAVHAATGKRRRIAEHEADLFAVEVMQDPGLVIRTLNKMAHLNQTPTRLVGMDEKLSTHPSIVNRERAIRERYGEP